MENVKAFLETSTIHGLTYISTTKKYVRLFWILVVISGFMFAGVLIYQSVETWEETPVKTTIETLPISKLTLPKVTVCPPENTYTDLNYDLMIAENIIIDNLTRKELTNYASELLLQKLNETVIKNVSMLEDDKRYYNWYLGNTQVKIFTLEYDAYYIDDLNTFAKTGNISTQFFGENFDESKVNPEINIMITVNSPGSCGEGTLHFQIEKVPIKGIASGLEKFYINGKLIDADISRISENFSASETESANIMYTRKVSKELITNLNMKTVPGFKLHWFHTGCDPEYEENIENFLIHSEQDDIGFSKNEVTRQFVR